MKRKLLFLGLILINPLFLFNIFCQQQFASEIFVGPNPATMDNAVGYIFHSDVFPGTNNLGIQARRGSAISFLLYNNQNTMRAFNILRGMNQDITLWFPTENQWNRFTTATGGAFAFSSNGRGNTDDQADLVISRGSVGIGGAPSDDATHKLVVTGNSIIHFPQTHIELTEGRNSNPTLNFSNTSWNRINAAGDLAFFTNNRGSTSDTPQLLIAKGGQVCIGGIFAGISQANQNRYNLFVDKGILSEDFAIGPRSSWADHVLKADYKLMDLKEVESYITDNNKLPDIPSAAEVQENGYSLHEMNVKLLQKIEELTLYVIGQEKEINKLKNMLEVK